MLVSEYHIPVLLKESVDGLNVQPDGIYVDATYGGGGYSRAILGELKHGKLYAFDMDEEAATDLPKDSRFTFIHGNFRYLKNYMKFFGVEWINGIVADLGVSSRHFDEVLRGFTYKTSSPLDMRMNSAAKITAADIVNTYEENELTRIFRDYAEIPRAAKIARLITDARSKEKIDTSSRLIDCIRPIMPAKSENQFLSRIFQALRIEVNHELENLRILLSDAGNMLKPGGRMVVISYHSLEDRMVKNHMRWGETGKPPGKDLYGQWNQPYRVITRKPVSAGEKEVSDNPRSRSAHLRIAEKQ